MITPKQIYLKAKGFVTGNKSYWDKVAKQYLKVFRRVIQDEKNK